MQGRLADKNKLSAFLEERNAYMERTKNNQSKEYIKILFSTVLKKY